MHVLHCIHSLAGGGAERQLCLLVNSLSLQGIQSSVFCVDDAGSNIEMSSVDIYKCNKKSKYDFSIYRQVLESIDSSKPDIIHAWLPASVTIPSMIAANTKKIPCVFSYRNSMRFHRPISYPEYLISTLFSAGIVSNNPIQQSTWPFRFMFKQKKGKVIANAVRVDSSYRRNTSATDLCCQKKIILFVGRITTQKNWQCLLESLPLLDGVDDWELHVCGHGEDESRFKELANQLGVFHKIKMFGYVPNIYEHMSNASILVLPSWHEGMPNVFLEALSIGLPCVVSDISANRAIINETRCALVFPPNSPAALAACVAKVLNDNALCEAMAHKGLSVAAEYSVDSMAWSYSDYYSGILKKNNL